MYGAGNSRLWDLFGFLTNCDFFSVLGEYVAAKISNTELGTSCKKFTYRLLLLLLLLLLLASVVGLSVVIEVVIIVRVVVVVSEVTIMSSEVLHKQE